MNRFITLSFFVMVGSSLMHSQWTSDPSQNTLISSASGEQSFAQVIRVAEGRSIVVWQDFRSGVDFDIYAQRIDSTGIAEWTANGVVICNAIGNQNYPTLVSDGGGGAIITWFGGSGSDVYAQRINSLGVVQWTANGVAISTAASGQQ